MTDHLEVETCRKFWEILDHDVIDVEAFRELIRQYPQSVVSESGIACEPLLSSVAKMGRIDLMQIVVEAGGDVNSNAHDGYISPLISALGKGQLAPVKFLLENGAEPNYDRPFICALNAEENSLEMIKLLVEHGANINECFTFGPKGTPLQNALSWAILSEKHDVVDFLRAHGAVMPGEPVPTADAPKSLSDEIIKYFSDNFGSVRPLALQQIVDEGPPIAIHVISPSEKLNCLTLFTTGLSEQPMKLPAGQDDYRFAELFMQLPADWRYTEADLANPRYGWPFCWIRDVAQYPHENDTWLGGPVTVIANEEPPQPLAPGLPFTCLLLLVEKTMTSKDGRLINFYRMMPLYTEERDLEKTQGAPALMNALDAAGTAFVVDLNRPNAASPH